MHSEDNNTLFAAWSEAERQAREAERQLYALILTQGGRPAGQPLHERLEPATQSSHPGFVGDAAVGHCCFEDSPAAVQGADGHLHRIILAQG